MEINKRTLNSFSVIGKEGSTSDGEGFIGKLWEDATEHFEEIAPLAKRDETGGFAGFWGAMTDFSRSFMPWEDGFSKGLYLAGAECRDDADAPDGWKKWTIPAYEYIYVETNETTRFSDVIAYLNENGIPLAGAVHDFNCPQTGKHFMFFPIKKL